MGCSSSISLENKNKEEKSYQNFNWKGLYEKLSTLKEEYNRKRRVQIWTEILNAGKNESLDYDKLKEGMEKYLDLPKEVLQRGPIKLSFDGAKDKYKCEGKVISDGKLEFNEFRLFLIYLKQFFQYYELFIKADNSQDNQIDFNEFTKAIPIMKEFGIDVNDEHKIFDAIDTNHDQTISFEELVKYVIQASIKADTDDPLDIEALKLL